jgi:hypothetical protein
MNAIRNPVLWLAWGLPAVAVAACVLTLLITIRNPDAQLPEQYHWEGFKLDRDFSQAARAEKLGVLATISGFDAAGRCEVRLRTNGPAPERLVLHVAHATLASLDQRVSLNRIQARSGGPGVGYSGNCARAGDGHWRLELVDSVNGWAVRQSVRGALNSVTLDAVAGRNE